MLRQLKEVMGKVLLSLGAFVVCHIPVGLIVIFKYLLNPEGFWQKAVVYGAGIYIFGGIQIVLWIVLVAFLVIMWKE
ncbi:MAG: hypothetical protein KAW92_09590 [Candidatus Cloacimonetes bacterium]|nr:hypothetical protein [Candidatus Cloacimonadota bacterium]